MRSSLLFLFVVACGPSPEPVAPTVEPAKPQTTWGDSCKKGEAKSEADLMGWDAGSRANVNVLRRQGIVAVRYMPEKDSCRADLELVPDCIGEGSYLFAPYPGSDKRVVHDQLELGAKLPVFKLDLSGKLTSGRALRTDFDLAGVMTLPAGKPFARSDLHGQGCARATHVVSRVYLGGFTMMVGETSSIEAAATIFGLGASTSKVKEAESLATEGNAEACAAAQKTGKEDPRCAVPLRLAFLAINDATALDYAGKTGPDEHGCQRGKQVWNGKVCEDLKLDPNGQEIWNSLTNKK